MDVNLDDVDWAIIGQLQQDARISISELGRRVKLSSSATTERVRHLEALGVITGYHAAVDLTKAGYPVLAVVRLKYPGNHHQPLRRLLEERHEILECLRTTGDDCYTLKVAATSMGHLETIMDELASFGSTTTSVVYSQTLPYRGPDRPLCIRLGPVRLRGSTGLASGKPGNYQRFTSHLDRGSCELVSVEEAVPPQDQEQQEPEKPKGRGFRPDIQGLRALAVGMVVIYHLYPSLLTGGFAGVDVFFVISGFLITGHLLREYHKTGKVALLDFWGRRAKRLVPAAALVLTVTWVASRLLLPATRLADTASQIRASALYFQNWQLAANAVNYLKSDSAASPVQHFWSLSVEEQFYLGWPLLFLLAALAALTARRTGRRRARGHHVALLLAAAVVAGSLWYSVYYTHANPAGAYFVTTTRIWELGLGGLLALLPAGLSRRIGRLGLLGWAGLGLVIASAFVLSGTNAFPGYLALLPAGGTAALILGGSAAGRFGPHRLTSARPMVFIGGISYSLYLWHWPLIVCYTARSGRAVGPVSGLAIVVAAVTLSWLTKVWVEDKVRTASLLSGHGWRSVSTALAAVVPVVLVSLYITAEPGPWNGRLGPDYPGAAALADKVTNGQVKSAPVLPPPSQIKLPTYWQQGCLVAEASATPKACAYGDTSHPVATVVLAGDSIAGDWFTPLQRIAVQRHWKLVTELHSVCPLTAAVMVTPSTGGPYSACHAWGAAVVHNLETKIKPDVVITSGIPGLATIRHPGGGAAAQADIGAGMARYWKRLEGHGISVVAIKESPTMGLNVPECVTDHPTSPRKCAVPDAKAIAPDLPTVYATRAAAGTVPLIDMNSLICGRTKCPPIVGNVLVYQDSHHLTSTYALTTAPYLEKRLLKVSKALSSA